MKKGSSSSSAYNFLKHIISVLSSMARAKSMAIRNKANALKARAIVLSLLKNRKFSLPSFSHKIQAILGHQHSAGSHGDDDDDDDDESKAILLYNAASSCSHSQLVHHQDAGGDDRDYQYHYDEAEEDDKYPDLRHSLFEEEEDELDLGGPNESVIDLVRNAREGGEEFKLEDEIDHVADLFIMKFHKRMRLQKLESFKRHQESFKRYQEMLQRGL